MIIVSFTSWKDRIENVPAVCNSILNQSLKADSIELNLSTDEFPNKENELPGDVIKLVSDGLLKINWVKENTKSFKKFIPVLKKYYGQEYLLLTIDDDLLYGSDYIKMMVSEAKDCDVFCPNSGLVGNRAIYRSSIFDSSFWEKLPNDIIDTGVDDTYIRFYLNYKKAKLKFKFTQAIRDQIKIYNPVNPLCNFYRKNNRVDIAVNLSRSIWQI